MTPLHPMRVSAVFALVSLASGLRFQPSKPFFRGTSRSRPRVQLAAPAPATAEPGTKYSALTIGVLKETDSKDNRVVQSPTSVKLLTKI